jgi:hypothetical protein
MFLSTFWAKTVFSAIFQPKNAENRPFLAPFLCNWAGMGAYLPPLTISTTDPCSDTPPRQ